MLLVQEQNQKYFDNLNGQSMQQTSFQQHELYYQYESVWWEDRFQPIISTWVYLGKHVLSANAVPDDAVGYVFAY